MKLLPLAAAAAAWWALGPAGPVRIGDPARPIADAVAFGFVGADNHMGGALSVALRAGGAYLAYKALA